MMNNKYFDEEHNVILPQDYLKNINQYNCIEIIELGKEEHFKAIKKDFHKDFYCEMIEREIEPKWGENLLDHLIEFDPPTDYFIIHFEDLSTHLGDSLNEFLADLVNVMDFPEVRKFEILYHMIKEKKSAYAIKCGRKLRDIQKSPLREDYTHRALNWIENYTYNLNQ